MVRQIARCGVSTALARFAVRCAQVAARSSHRSSQASRRRRNTPAGRSRRPAQRSQGADAARARLPAPAIRGQGATSSRLRRRSAALVQPSTFGAPASSAFRRLSTDLVNASALTRATIARRRPAAIIARRSGFFFAVRFAGPARAFFMRRSRRLLPLGPDFSDLSRPHFIKATLTLRPWHAASP
jgi:hypothetical protein